MSSESEAPVSATLPEEEDPSKSISKKAAKKEAAKQEKLRRRQEVAAATAVSSLSVDEEGRLANNYGDVPLYELQSANKPEGGNWTEAVNGKEWTKVGELTESLKDQEVLIRGRVHTTRPVSSKLTFVVLRQSGFTVQCVVSQKPDSVTKQMVKFVSSLNRESFVDIIGIVSVPGVSIKGASQQVEVQVRKLYCISKAVPNLPINIEDAARSEIEIEKALQEGEQLVRVNQDTRLNYRVLDIRTPANQAIFRIQSWVGAIFREFFLAEDFVEIHTPKLIGGSSEGLDVEMEINKHYSEVMDIVGRLFVTIFDKLNEKCKKELEAVGKQYPFEPLKYNKDTLRLKFEEGVQMLKEAGVEIDPLGDLNTESERKLGQLVSEKYGTDFYILHYYPSNVRPFYTMISHENPLYSNSFDVFIRGEEIISGAQRVHVPEVLEERAQACGIDVKTISTYIDSFRYGAPPHGGFGVGLERVIMLFCGLNNIRKTSLYPRDPLRIAP
ncbi:hypothetical protein QYF36_015425 [Acer negundo]|nr:hypothetical protein QYF36_015425 [Acer negundo]